MKKFFLILFFLLIAPTALAQEADINFFYSPTCPHCHKEQAFLDELKEEYPDIVVNRYSVTDKNNVELLKEFYEKYNVPDYYKGMVPATFTEDNYFIGFNDGVAKDIEECLLHCTREGGSEGNFSVVDLEGNIDVPIIGKINVKKYSLPALAVVLGTLDGFNVCSLGALILILGLVLAIKSRKKTLLFGGIFILTTAIIYGLLIFIWFKVFSFFSSYLKIMQIIIGLIGIGGGIYFLKQFLKYRKYGPICEVGVGNDLISKFSNKFKNSLSESKNIFLLALSVLIFAGIITIVEFPCSAVIPVAFAGILAEANLSGFYYLLYIAIFVLFYMLDEIIVFLIAFFTMKIWLTSSKAITWITLVEAIILISLGIYYLL